MSIFNYYPKIQYNNITGVNLLVEAEVIQKYLKDYTAFFAYTVKEGERADIIAYREYNDPKLDWVLYLINGIVDPYKDWVMDYNQFIKYLETKYNISADKLTSTTNPDTIAYYYYQGLPSDDAAIINSYNYTMTPATYTKLGSPAGWVAKSIFDYENELNEKKRDIKILRSVYISDLKQQVKDLFNG
jgi:hypothetical protein